MANSSFAKLNIIVFLILFGLLVSPVALALELEYPDWFPIKEKMELSELVLNLFNIFLVVAGVAAFVILVVAGIRYLTSIGNPSVLADARSQAFSAILGLALLLASYLILTTINPQLVELKEPGLVPISPAVYAPPGKIAVAVEKPKEEKKEYDIGTGVQEIKLAGSLSLFIDTDALKAWLIADKEDQGLPGDRWQPWEETLKAERTITVGQTLTVPVNVKDLTEGEQIPVKFIISVGKKFVDKLALSWEIKGESSLFGKTSIKDSTTIDVPTQQYLKEWKMWGVTIAKLTIEPPSTTWTAKLELGTCLIVIDCKTVEETKNLRGKIELKESIEADMGILGKTKVEGKVTIEWKKE